MSLLNRKLILALLLSPAIAFAHNPAKEEWWPAPGGLFGGSSFTQTFNVNAAANRVAYCGSFHSSCRILKTRFRNASITGTPDSDDVVLALFSTTANRLPDTSLESCNSVTTAVASNQWTEHTCWTQTVSRSVPVCFVLSNAAATPASNYFTPEVPQDGGLGWHDTDFGTWVNRTSTNSGSSWSTNNSPSQFIVECDTDPGAGTTTEVFGTAYETRNNPASAAAGDLVYTTRKVGAYFTVPPGAGKCFRGVGANIGTVGTPSGDISFEVFNDTTLVATTDALSNALSLTDGIVAKQYFDGKYCLPGGATGRVSMKTSSGGDTSNGHALLTVNVRNDATDRTTLPADGTWVFTVYDGSSWTQTNTKSPWIWLILDGDDPDNSAAASGSSGPKQNLPGSGGMQ